MRLSLSKMAAAIAAVASCVSFTIAQPCGQWSDAFALNKLGGRIQASVMFDDGTGPALYVAGEFANSDFPGRKGIAKWNGSQFIAVGGGLNGPGWALTVFDDDGNGPHAPALYVGGTFTEAGGVPANSLAKWNGTTWADVDGGVVGTVYALQGHDDGSGPGLYIGGDFFNNSCIQVHRNGAWSDLAGGVQLFGNTGYVMAMASFQGSLYVGGFFDTAGGVAANAIAKWSNGAFTTLGTGLNAGGSSAVVSRLLAVDLPSTNGPALIVAGSIQSAGGVNAGPIVRWNGTTWATMNAGFSSAEPKALCVYNDGTGDAIFAGGVLTQGSGVSKWTGTTWELIASVPLRTGVPLGIDTMTVMTGNRLFTGGMFTRIGSIAAPCAATYSNGQWTAADAWGLGLDGAVNALDVFDVGDGPRLYAGGSFRLAGGVNAAGVARMNAAGTAWEPVAVLLSPASGSIKCMEVFNDGTGPALYVGGSFTLINDITAANIAKWRPGQLWQQVGAGLSSLNTQVFGSVYSLEVHRDPGAATSSLYATGLIQYTGQTQITNVVKLVGNTWTSVGAGPGPIGTGGAYLRSIDLDGAGPNSAKLYFGGVFLPISSWNGTTWTPEPFSLNTTVVSCIEALDTGSGMAIYAGGDITSPFIGSLAKRGIDAWENVGISPRFPNGGGSGGSADNGAVKAILAVPQGAGTSIYMTGILGSRSSTGYQNVAAFDGNSWYGLGGGLASRFPGPDGRGAAMVSHNNAIYVGGKFERYYNDSFETEWHATYNVAKWIPCAPLCSADFNQDGVLDFFDYLDFVAAFAVQDPSADFNADSVIDFFDYLDFVQAFAVGC